MAAPAPTPRVTPAGLRLKDGFSTKITLARDTNIEFWEKTVKPAGLDGGDSVDISTMHNSKWRQMAPRKLVTLTPTTTKAGYDPVVYTSIVESLNIETTITLTFPDGSTVAFFGYLQKFEPDDNQEGTMPEATITIVPTNIDSSGVEWGPTVTPVSGT